MEKFELKENVKNKLAEAIELWADEYLVGKPALLANGVYFNLVQLLESKTLQINETFKD